MKEKKNEGYQTVIVAETTRPALADNNGSEISIHDALAKLLNDVQELKEKLIGK